VQLRAGDATAADGRGETGASREDAAVHPVTSGCCPIRCAARCASGQVLVSGAPRDVNRRETTRASGSSGSPPRRRSTVPSRPGWTTGRQSAFTDSGLPCRAHLRPQDWRAPHREPPASRARHAPPNFSCAAGQFESGGRVRANRRSILVARDGYYAAVALVAGTASARRMAQSARELTKRATPRPVET
jgi:hypothetical protein